MERLIIQEKERYINFMLYKMNGVEKIKALESDTMRDE